MGSVARKDYKVEPAGAEAAEGMGILGRRTFGNDPMQRRIFPKDREHLTPRDEFKAWRTRSLGKRLMKEGNVTFKVVDPSDSTRIIGMAQWSRPYFFANPENDKRAAGEDETPACVDLEARNQLMEALDGARKETWRDDWNFWYLGTLAVDEDYRRQGIATLLMEWGIQQAEKDGLPLYLEATPMGALFYPSLGFEAIKVIPVMDGACDLTLMIKYPKKCE
ncbi:Hypothetical protein R9X50_00621200 [Acrodontium crateriforme]|uniref:N-acetyltransferase domain-containing protein n=1 Tax=Acrodontium crateriforme TaxID=150365 RepID=A0AAQ3M9A9_9PEZI|nr:Hypothetical protein R9X50_00621200 [Acrodontium crateriforme]